MIFIKEIMISVKTRMVPTIFEQYCFEHRANLVELLAKVIQRFIWRIEGFT